MLHCVNDAIQQKKKKTSPLRQQTINPVNSIETEQFFCVKRQVFRENFKWIFGVAIASKRRQNRPREKNKTLIFFVLYFVGCVRSCYIWCECKIRRKEKKKKKEHSNRNIFGVWTIRITVSVSILTFFFSILFRVCMCMSCVCYNSCWSARAVNMWIPRAMDLRLTIVLLSLLIFTGM